MPFARPTRAQLIDQSAADIERRIGGTDARLRRALVTVFAIVLGGVIDGLYGYLAWIAKQIFVQSMEDEFLDRRASLWGLARKGPTAATGPVGVTGTTGVPIPGGTLLNRADGIVYATTADVVIAGGVATLAVLAQIAGTIGNTAANVQFQFQVPIPGVANPAIVAAALTGGNDAETNDELRARIEERQAEPPQGGSAKDYEEWALEQPGVTRAWCLPKWMGPGTVGVTFVMDGRADIIPLAGDLTAVQAAIDVLRPVRATLFVVAPNVDTVDTSYHLVPSTAATQAAAAAALADLFARQQTAAGGTILLTDLDNAVKNAAGVVDFARAAPLANIVTPLGTLAVFGAPTWT